MVVLALPKIKFGHAQISVPKIGIPMSKTTCINPCMWKLFAIISLISTCIRRPLLGPLKSGRLGQLLVL